MLHFFFSFFKRWKLFLPVHIPLLSLLFAPYFVWDFKRTFTMGLVEEIDTLGVIEKEDLDEAANANFANPNPNTIKNSYRNVTVLLTFATNH